MYLNSKRSCTAKTGCNRKTIRVEKQKLKNMKKLNLIIVLFISLFSYSQENGVYKSEYGQFILTISNYSRTTDFLNFKLEGSANNPDCNCLEISGKAEMNGNDIVGFDYVENNTVFLTITPSEMQAGVFEVYFHNENPEFCGNCFEVDTIFKKVVNKKTITKKPLIKKAKK